MESYPKAFSDYYHRAELDLPRGMSLWVRERIRRIAYRAWVAGRRHQKDRVYVENGFAKFHK